MSSYLTLLVIFRKYIKYLLFISFICFHMFILYSSFRNTNPFHCPEFLCRRQRHRAEWGFSRRWWARTVLCTTDLVHTEEIVVVRTFQAIVPGEAVTGAAASLVRRERRGGTRGGRDPPIERRGGVTNNVYWSPPSPHHHIHQQQNNWQVSLHSISTELCRPTESESIKLLSFIDLVSLHKVTVTVIGVTVLQKKLYGSS